MVGIKDFFLSLITLGTWGLYRLLKVKGEIDSLRLSNLDPIKELVDGWGFIPQIKEKLGELDDLRKKYEELDRRNFELSKKSEDLVEYSREWERKMGELQDLLRGKEDAIRHKDEMIDRFKEEKMALMNQRDFVDAKFKEVSSSLENFKNKCEVSQGNVIKLQSQNESLMREKENLNREIGEWQDLNDGKTLARVKEDKKRAEEEISRIYGADLNVNNSGSALEDWVQSELETISRGCLGQLKVERQLVSESSSGRGSRIDFLLSFYSGNKPESDFKMVLECKNTLSPTEKDISKKYYKQALEYARSCGARFAVIVTTLNFDNKKEGYLLIDGGRWESIFGELQRSTDPIFYVICPTFLSSFIFLTLNVKSCFSAAKSLGFNELFSASQQTMMKEIMNNMINNLDQFRSSFNAMREIVEKQRKALNQLLNHNTKLEKQLDAASKSTLECTEGGRMILENLNSSTSLPESSSGGDF